MTKRYKEYMSDEKKEKPLVITDATGLIDEDDTDEYKTTLL